MIDIRPGNLRDLSYIAANMRLKDWQECLCQYPEGTTPETVAWVALNAGESWTAHHRGQPVAAFGVAPILPHVLSLWAWGTKGMRRTVPAITRFVRDELAPEWVERGITRIEARSLVGHEEAHRWMLGTGAVSVPSPCWGRSGEDFLLFSWTRDAWLAQISGGNS